MFSSESERERERERRFTKASSHAKGSVRCTVDDVRRTTYEPKREVIMESGGRRSRLAAKALTARKPQGFWT